MPSMFALTWTGVGVSVGLALAIGLRHLLSVAPPAANAVRLTAVLLTAVTFGALTWRFGHQFDLLPYGVLAAFGVALGVIDVFGRRLPSVFVYLSVALVGVLFATSAILHSRGLDFLCALVGMAVVAVFTSRSRLYPGGGLGAGDVKLGWHARTGARLAGLAGTRHKPPSSAGSQPPWYGCCFEGPGEGRTALWCPWDRSCSSER
ncbi:A24 family peptidase [Amycolatopsis sp. NPDC051102]|uniref:A24 family peptidase n=1 Tax=Amycolatopsis sp. NPDC051102 TaxID=3155163 RepID=UPI00342A98DD